MLGFAVITAVPEQDIHLTNNVGASYLSPKFLLNTSTKKNMSVEIDLAMHNFTHIRSHILSAPSPKDPHHLAIQLRDVAGNILDKTNHRCIQWNLEYIPNSQSIAHGVIPFFSQYFGLIELILFNSWPPFFSNPY